MEDFKEFFNSPTYADVSLCFSGHELPAHRLILTKGSDYFKALLDSKFRVRFLHPLFFRAVILTVSDAQEANSSFITLQGDSPKALSGMICTFYGHTAYDKRTSEASEAGVLQLTYIVDLYVAANKYLVPTLCTQIAADFPVMLEAVKGGPGYSSNIERLAWHVYDRHATAAEELRKPIVALITKSIDEWRAAEELGPLLKGLPEMALDIISAMADVASTVKVGKARKADDEAGHMRVTRASKRAWLQLARRA